MLFLGNSYLFLYRILITFPKCVKLTQNIIIRTPICNVCHAVLLLEAIQNFIHIHLIAASNNDNNEGESIFNLFPFLYVSTRSFKCCDSLSDCKTYTTEPCSCISEKKFNHKVNAYNMRTDRRDKGDSQLSVRNCQKVFMWQ